MQLKASTEPRTPSPRPRPLDGSTASNPPADFATPAKALEPGALDADHPCGNTKNVAGAAPSSLSPESSSGIDVDAAALRKALLIARGVCDKIHKASPPEVWKTTLRIGLQSLLANTHVVAAVKAVAHKTVDVESGELLASFSVNQAQNLLGRLEHTDKKLGINNALTLVHKACEAAEHEGEWRQELESGLQRFPACESLNKALKTVVKEELQQEPVADSGSSCPSVSLLTVEQLGMLRDELTSMNQTAQEEVPVSGTRPSGLVRALRELFAAGSVEEAAKSLSPCTADEEALESLVERTEIFAPALDELRAKAIDREFFLKIAAGMQVDTPDEMLVDNDAKESAQPLVSCNEKLPLPIKLPPGWKMVWVQRRKKEVYEFVDPQGRRYQKVWELRTALSQGWEAVNAAKAKNAANRSSTLGGLAATAPKRTQTGKANRRPRARW